MLRFIHEVFHDAAFGPASTPAKTRPLLSARGALWLDTADFPIQWCFLDRKRFLDLSHGGQRLFTDPRSQALIQGWEKSEAVRLVGAIGRLGEFAVVSLATILVRFEEVEGQEDGDGAAGRLNIDTRPLHIFVKVVPVVDEEILWNAGDVSARAPNGVRLNNVEPVIP